MLGALITSPRAVLADLVAIGASHIFVTATAAFLVIGCAGRPEILPFETQVTQLQATPAKYRFDVYGDPGLKLDPAIRKTALPVHERIRLGMRRYAEDEVAKRGLCQDGFTGPDIVIGQKMSPKSFFFIECLAKSE